MAITTINIQDIDVNPLTYESTLTKYAYHALSKRLPSRKQDDSLDPWEYGHSFALQGEWGDGSRWHDGYISQDRYCEVLETVVFIYNSNVIAVVTASCDTGD